MKDFFQNFNSRNSDLGYATRKVSLFTVIDIFVKQWEHFIGMSFLRGFLIHLIWQYKCSVTSLSVL